MKNSLAANTDKIQQVLNGLYLGQYPLSQIYDHLVTPVLHEIGKLWSEGKVSIAEEHIASQSIRDAVIRLQGIIRVPPKKNGKVLCLNFSNEFHSMALKMVAHILELKGYKVLFAGQNTPLIQIEKVFESYHPNRVYISGTYVETKDSLQEEFNKIANLCLKYKSKLYVGGRAFDIISIQHPALVRRLMNFQDVNAY